MEQITQLQSSVMFGLLFQISNSGYKIKIDFIKIWGCLLEPYSPFKEIKVKVKPNQLYFDE